jgi:hypothetical protein
MAMRQPFFRIYGDVGFGLPVIAVVVDAGKHPVRVEWGEAALTKVVSIVRPEIPTGGYVSMRLEPPFAPGKAFGVTAIVSDPLPGQTLTLELPTGLPASAPTPGKATDRPERPSPMKCPSRALPRAVSDGALDAVFAAAVAEAPPGIMIPSGETCR